MREALLNAQQQTVILCLNARFQIRHRVRTAHYRIEHGADRAADDEVGAEVVQIVGAQHIVAAKLALNAEIHLLHHRDSAWCCR